MTEPTENTGNQVDETLRRRYETDWTTGSAGALSEYLPDPGSSGYLATLEELVHIQLEFAWKARQGAGDQPTAVEELLGEFSDLRTPDILLRLLKQEFACRAAAGDKPTPAEYARRFPALVVTGREVMPDAEQTFASEPTPAGQDDTEMAVNEVDNTAILDQPTELTTGDIGIDDGEQTLAMPAGAPTTQPTRMPGIGDTIAGFCLENELGRGGMGVVYEAAHNQTGRRVALKLLSQELAGNAETMARFLREAQLAAALSHPRSTFVFEAGEDQGYPYIVMELMPGRTLKDLADDEGPMSVNRAVDMVLDVIDGLSAAHEAGVIHRDVKPSNCFVDSDGRLKVGDYGLSKSLVTDSDLTQSGSFLGTPLYSAPEQIRGDEVDERTDLYAVGATLFTLIAGRAPFTGESAAVIAQIVSDQPPLLSSLAEDIPGDLDRIINRSLHKEPAKRFQALEELRNALAPFATSGSPVADIGRRLAAYMIDHIIFHILWMVATFLLGIAFDVKLQDLIQAVLIEASSTKMWVLYLAGGVTAAVLYFGICESLWGGGVGKRAVGLRVVSGDGGRPSFLQATGRALCLPGSVVLAGFMANTLVTDGVDGFSYWYTTILELCFGPAIVLLLCARMRPANGFRAWHDQWTNTRITRVRKATSGALLSDIPVLAPVTADPLPTGFGPYETTGALGLMNGRPVFEGRDRQLKRTVWMVARGDGQSPATAQRTEVERPTRPRWLQSSDSGQSGWDVFESVEGAPLRLLTNKNGLPWDNLRVILRDAASELRIAADDKSLPEHVSIDQVWVDRGGRARLLDAPLDSMTHDEELDPVVPLPPVALLREAMELCVRNLVVPASAHALITGLEQRDESIETLDWAVAELEELCQRPGTMKWDDRLGLLCFSNSAESWIYMLVAVLGSWGVTRLFRLAFDLQNQIGISAIPLALSVIITTLVCVGLGAATRGGIGFWYLGITVQTRDGNPASPLRCGLRNALAWMPFLFLFCLIGWLTATEFATEGPVVTLYNEGREACEQGNHVETEKYAGLLAANGDALGDSSRLQKGESYYHAACLYSMASDVAGNNFGLSSVERQNLVDRSLALLEKAHDIGLFIRQDRWSGLHGSDMELNPIRENSNFQLLVSQMRQRRTAEQVARNAPASQQVAASVQQADPLRLDADDDARLAAAESQMLTAAATSETAETVNQLIWGFGGIFTLLSMIAWFISALATLGNPTRGFQDLLSGTQIAPK